ncbi:FAD-binding oxidoreductase [Rhodovarius crocodyli]|uniref:FAD-binding oxidoreductase n=1 Tax=Rhodovarius crocodyli TaxID=1979269 RepID=A0A437MEU3_9PROT|nr:FAD-binding oxidoreductase [Rhodovarius crocodyli]RVT96157.1 FAD-binding oxidoreductase [Rhodovarius crocodyli]
MDGFKSLLGAGNVLTAPQDIAPHAVDWRGQQGAMPAAVVRPGTTEQAAGVLRLAAEYGMRVVPHGGRTGLSGAAIPQAGEAPVLVVSMERMNRIRLLDPLDMSIAVDAGITVQAVQEAAREAGRYFPLSFGAQGTAQIGGALSTNAGGINTIRYGNARDLVLGLEVVLPDGRVLDDMRRIRKDNTGYALRHLYLGAEGTLGLITGASLKLFPALRTRETAFLSVPSPHHALRLLARMQDSGADLVAFELMDSHLVELTVGYVPGLRLPVPLTTPWCVIIEAGSPHPSAPVRELMEAALAEGIEAGEAIDVMLAESEQARSMIWRIRESAPEASRSTGPAVPTDTAVPVSVVPDFLDAVLGFAGANWPGMRVGAMGHLGDGNIHISLHGPHDMPRDQWLAVAGGFAEGVNALAVERGGSFSAEHGIGITKLKGMTRFKNPLALSLMRRIKAALDPAGIMNPGKVLPPG